MELRRVRARVATNSYALLDQVVLVLLEFFFQAAELSCV